MNIKISAIRFLHYERYYYITELNTGKDFIVYDRSSTTQDDYFYTQYFLPTEPQIIDIEGFVLEEVGADIKKMPNNIDSGIFQGNSNGDFAKCIGTVTRIIDDREFICTTKEFGEVLTESCEVLVTLGDYIEARGCLSFPFNEHLTIDRLFKFPKELFNEQILKGNIEIFLENDIKTEKIYTNDKAIVIDKEKATKLQITKYKNNYWLSTEIVDLP